MDDSKVLKKILAVVEKQQTILKKLAQVSQEDPGIRSYLQSAWQTAGLNTGITEMSTPHVTFQPSTSVALSGTDDTTASESKYIVSGPIPVKMREKFNQTFYNQIKSQKSDLDGRVSAIYEDPKVNQNV